ncbi:MAG: FAD-binding oxidoreductase [Pseudomonadota bacterium]
MSDIIVIGGGIAGLSAAARLSSEAKVTVLEKEAATGYHASGRSAAMFEENYGSPSTVALNKASAAYHKEAHGGYLSPRGFMILAKSEEAEAFESDAQSLGADPISITKALEYLPVLNRDAVAFAGYHADAMDIDTDRLMQDFIRVLRANNGVLHTNSPVTQIAWKQGMWRVTAGAQVYEAEILVNAAGAWADHIAHTAGIAPLGITPHRRSIARVPAPEGYAVNRWPMFFGVGETWYAKPDAGALLISPADEDPVEPQDAWADDMVLAAGIARYQAMIRPEVTRLLTSWAGLRSFAPDRALVLGPEPSMPSFVWCAGQGGYGFQTAPAASALLADLIMNRNSSLADDVVADLTPGRLRI